MGVQLLIPFYIKICTFFWLKCMCVIGFGVKSIILYKYVITLVSYIFKIINTALQVCEQKLAGLCHRCYNVISILTVLYSNKGACIQASTPRYPSWYTTLVKQYYSLYLKSFLPINALLLLYVLIITQNHSIFREIMIDKWMD